jgi:hypothetical protein
MELHRPSQHTLCSRSLRPLLDALVELTRDADLDDAEVSLRLDQYGECALGTRSPELAFDPMAMELTALASSVEAEVLPRWSRRVNALFESLRGLRVTGSREAVERAMGLLLAMVESRSPGHLLPRRTPWARRRHARYARIQGEVQRSPASPLTQVLSV